MRAWLALASTVALAGCAAHPQVVTIDRRAAVQPIPTVVAPPPPVAPIEDVVTAVDLVTVRAHPEGARVVLGLDGTRELHALALDPAEFDAARDGDWMIVARHDRRDLETITIGYHVADERFDRAIRAHDAFPLATRGFRAWRVSIEGSERVVLRGAHVVAMADAARAEDVARDLAQHPPSPRFEPNEALHSVVARPWEWMRAVPRDVVALRASVVSRPKDGGTDVDMRFECPDEGAARTDAQALRDFVHEKNSFAVRLLTHGILNHATITTEGHDARVRIDATHEQVAAIVMLAAQSAGARLPP